MEIDRRTVGVHIPYVGQRIRQTENNSVAEVLQIGIWDRRGGGGGILEIEWKGQQTARRTGGEMHKVFGGRKGGEGVI